MQKSFFKISASFCCLLASASFANAAVTPQTEVFGKAADGTTLRWDVYTPAGSGPWPAVLAIHGGGFTSGSPDSSPDSISSAQDLAAAGYLVFSIEYRLAPPGRLPGQISAGRFPDQSNDVKLAVRAARADARCNGQVGAVGGSAGGYETAFVAGTGTKGDDRIDVGVALSGLYDCSDFSPSPTLSGYTETVLNYVNVPITNTEALRAASPAWLADKDTAPLLLVNSVGDSMPYIQLPQMMAHLDALGVTNYQAVTVPGSGHAWDNWSLVKTQALAFLADHFAGLPSPPPFPPPLPEDGSTKLLNVSTRATVGVDQNVMIGGFIVTGDIAKRVVLRGLGPSLGQAGLSGALADPVLELYDAAGTLIESNDNPTVIPGIVNPLSPANPSEPLLTAILPSGSYTAVLHGVDTTTGLALVELYDVNPASSQVSNISTRGQAGAGSNVMIGGFIVGGSDPTQVLIRALGPSLVPFGISGALADPVLEVYDGSGNLLFSNDNWRATQAQEISATDLAPTSDREAAVLATLIPGNYTALVHDARFSTGVGLVEAYDLEQP